MTPKEGAESVKKDKIVKARQAEQGANKSQSPQKKISSRKKQE
jgi:hypothetical protein